MWRARPLGAGFPVDFAVATVVSLVVLGPLVLLPGYSLRGDMVFVPDMPWKDAWLGLDGSAPRAVPMDALVSVATYVVPGWLVQKAALLGALVAGGVGAGRLVGEEPAYARAAAILLFLWNPWVAERLSIGQWAIVAGYCTLPLLALAARRVRDDVRRGWPYLVIGDGGLRRLQPVEWTHGRVRGARRRPRAAPDGEPRRGDRDRGGRQPALVGPVAAAAERRSRAGAGVLLVRGTCGVGGRPARERPVPGRYLEVRGGAGGRTSAVIVLASVAVTLIAIVGLRAGRGDRRLRGALVAVGVISFAAAYVPGLTGPASWLDDASSSVPGVALLRDSHRFLGPAVLMLLPGFAAAVRWLAEHRRPGREAMGALAGVVALLPVLLLPSLAWGLAGKLAPSSYPDEWDSVAGILESEDDGRTIVLPWYGSYRGFEWNRDQAVLDPAPRYLPGPVLIDDSLVLGDSVLPPESDDVAAVGRALESEDPAGELRELGIRWVLVEKDMAAGRVPSGEVVHSGPGLDLVDLGRAAEVDGTGPPPALVLAADGLVIGVLGAAVAAVFVRRLRTPRWRRAGPVGHRLGTGILQMFHYSPVHVCFRHRIWLGRALRERLDQRHSWAGVGFGRHHRRRQRLPGRPSAGFPERPVQLRRRVIPFGGLGPRGSVA